MPLRAAAEFLGNCRPENTMNLSDKMVVLFLILCVNDSMPKRLDTMVTMYSSTCQTTLISPKNVRLHKLVSTGDV